MIALPTRATAAACARTLGLAAAGGLVLEVLGVPAAFVSGAILTTAAAAVAGARLNVPEPVRVAAFVLVGVVVGSTIDRQTLALLPQWPISLAALAVALAVLLVVLPRYFSAVHGLDRSTARLCAVPGALSLIVALSDTLAVDKRRVAVLQSLRVLILMLIVPIAVAAGLDTLPAAPAKPWLSAADGLLALGAAVLAVPVARWIRLPAPAFTGPMFASGALFASGVVSGAVPEPVVAGAFVVMGASVGARFAGVDARYLAGCLGASLGGVAIAAGLTAVAAWPAAVALDQPFIQLWLALAPGGFEAMIALSIALDVDPAFVAGHQFARLVALYALIPFLFRNG